MSLGSYSFTLAVLVMMLQIVLAVGIVSYFLWREELFRWVTPRRAILASFLIALISTLGSLAYSKLYGLGVCELCWYQRIAMYPLAVMFGVALWRSRFDVVLYALPLSLIGLIISLYHYYLQVQSFFFGKDLAPCSTVGLVPSCSTVQVWELGYISIPLMAASAFAAVAFLSFLMRKNPRVL